LARQISLDPAATPERFRLARRLVAGRRPATEDYRPGTAVLTQLRRENHQHALDRVAAAALAPTGYPGTRIPHEAVVDVEAFRGLLLGHLPTRLKVKPGALARSTALAQARIAG
jgi:hypothetical protein